MLIFGAGDMFAVPLQDAYGNAITTSTPVRVLTSQEMSLSFSGDTKELYGQNTFAADIARGKTKMEGKVKGAQINGASLNALFFGQTMTAGTQNAVYVDNTGSVVPTSPYTITPTIPNSGTFVADLGVVQNGIPMTKVASAPTTGQYSFAAGVYTFAAADAGTTVFISFQYSNTIATAKRITVSNLAMGAAPSFKAFFANTYKGKRALTILNACVASKLMFLATKLDDYNIPEFDFTGQADVNNNVATIDVQE